jgi:hypothetical protein
MMTLREFASQEFAGLDIVSVSQPEPVLLDRNVMAVTDDVEQARAAVIALEDLEVDDARLGLVVLEPTWAPQGHDSGHADQEGATRLVAERAAIGAATGAIAGAALIGLVAAGLAGGNSGLIGAVVGAVAGAVLGAIISVFAGMGGSDAQRGTFVEPHEIHVCLVSLHTNDREEAKVARKRLADRDWADLFAVDANGKERRS